MRWASVCYPLSFYNYKSLENGVAPNVALTPLPLGKVGPMSPSVAGTSHPSGGEPPDEGANSRSRKRRATGELQPPASEAPCPPSFTASKPPPPPQDDKDSEVEIEVESRDERKLRTQYQLLGIQDHSYLVQWSPGVTSWTESLVSCVSQQSPRPCPPCRHHLSPRPAAQPRTWVPHVPKGPSVLSRRLRAPPLQLRPLQPWRPLQPKSPLQSWGWSRSWRAWGRRWTTASTPKSQRRSFCMR